MSTLSWPRVLPVVLSLAAVALGLKARDQRELLPSHGALSTFPIEVGSFRGTELPLSAQESEVLGPGEFMVRNYFASLQQPPINLFIAFFPSQRSGGTIHSPKNCLPGSGWAPLRSGLLPLQRAGGLTVSVNRYVIGKGLDRDVVLYWYQAHGRVTPSEYWAKLFLVSDAITLNRTDGALVRIVSPVDRAGEQAALARALAFAEQIFPLLDRYIPN